MIAISHFLPVFCLFFTGTRIPAQLRLVEHCLNGDGWFHDEVRLRRFLDREVESSAMMAGSSAASDCAVRTTSVK